MNPQFKTKLEALNKLNETKGRELETLVAILAFRAEAETAAEWEAVAESWWQEHLAHQHLVMTDQDPDGSHRQGMLTTAESGHKIVDDHNLITLEGTAYRFLGRAHSYQNDHPQAQKDYQVAYDILKQANDPRYLEVAGFLAETLIRTGQTEAGLSLAFNTFDAYDDAPAATLKKVDYYKWAVWRSGIFPRLVTALDELKIDYDHAKIRSYVEKSKTLLDDPVKYAYRIAEIESTLIKLTS